MNLDSSSFMQQLAPVVSYFVGLLSLNPSTGRPSHFRFFNVIGFVIWRHLKTLTLVGQLWFQNEQHTHIAFEDCCRNLLLRHFEFISTVLTSWRSGTGVTAERNSKDVTLMLLVHLVG